MSKTVLIGGGGYVGSAIVEHYSKKDKHILVIDNFIYNHAYSNIASLSLPTVSYSFRDYCKEKDRSQIVVECQSANEIVILAGLVGDPITKRYPELSRSVNLDDMKRLIDLIENNLSGKRIIFVSTCSNYGLMREGELANELSKLSPLSLYAKSKVEIENYIIEEIQHNSDNTYTILRFATAFGFIIFFNYYNFFLIFFQVVNAPLIQFSQTNSFGLTRFSILLNPFPLIIFYLIKYGVLSRLIFRINFVYQLIISCPQNTI